MGNLRSPKVYAFTVSIALALGLTCAGVRAGNPTAASGRARSAASLYNRSCVSCHGADGRSRTRKGKLKLARDISDSGWQESVSDERIFNSITNGRGKMPSFKKTMSDAEVDSIVLFVRALKK